MGIAVKSLAVVVAVSGGGCLYLDTINQRPSLEIENTTGLVIGRGDPIRLLAKVDDPDGHFVDVSWRAFVCDDASDPSTCDPTPVRESSDREFSFPAPIKRANDLPAQSLLVELEGTDNRGAIARPVQQLIIPLGNGKPMITLSHDSKYGTTIGTPIDVFAVYSDADDNADNVQLAFELVSPALSSATLTDFCTPQPACLEPNPMDVVFNEQGKTFTPDVAGNWEVRVTAVDPVGGEEGTTIQTETIVVVVDQLPCVGIVSPAPPIAPNILPITEPTLFQVHQIVDALDPFPTNVTDPILGAPAFHWSLKVNTGARQSLPTETGNNLGFDPASFSIGDIVEVRVEIEDRASPFPLTCDGADATCQLDPTLVPACLQRQTWKVEVR